MWYRCCSRSLRLVNKAYPANKPVDIVGAVRPRDTAKWSIWPSVLILAGSSATGHAGYPYLCFRFPRRSRIQTPRHARHTCASSCLGSLAVCGSSGVSDDAHRLIVLSESSMTCNCGSNGYFCTDALMGSSPCLPQRHTALT